METDECLGVKVLTNSPVQEQPIAGRRLCSPCFSEESVQLVRAIALEAAASQSQQLAAEPACEQELRSICRM